MKKLQQGFTLIELVVVIVILGILAVTAAPKFMNLQGDARNASLQGLKGSITSAANIVYGKSAIKGEESGAGSVLDGQITTAFGYPIAGDGTNTTTDKGIMKAINTGGDWFAKPNTANTGLIITFKQYKDQLGNGSATAIKNIPNGCYVEYIAATTGNHSYSVKVPENACKSSYKA